MNKIKKIFSWTIGIPAALCSFGECEDLRYWWVQFAAMGILIAILAWNGAFKQEEVYGK